MTRTALRFLASTLFIFSAVITMASFAQDNWTVQNARGGLGAIALDVKAIDPNIGWCVDKAGAVIRTTDGGVTWVKLTSPSLTQPVYGMDALDASTAVIISSSYVVADASIHRTTDGGATWNKVYSEMRPGAFFNAIWMFDATSGVVVGDPVAGKWTILKTTDGGATWTQMPTAPPQIGMDLGMLGGFAAVGSTHMWLTPGSGHRKVYRTTNGGATWGYSDLPFEQWTPGVWFVDANVGIVVAINDEAARTTDGGVTWKYIDFPVGPSEVANGVSGFGDNIFVTLGNKIYRSTDKGLTWRLSYAAAAGELFGALDMMVSGNQVRGWAAGTPGVLVMFSEILTSATSDGAAIPSSCRLDQNYPNPFNPSTTIRYGLPERAHVNLAVLNALGQQVAVLQNDEQEAGYHDVTFNGNGLSSGVYFYRIRTGDFVQTRRLLLLK
jgi:photosystem II stability/assembly factor-like uncharacterized protein